jgi:hypothetical protein
MSPPSFHPQTRALAAMFAAMPRAPAQSPLRVLWCALCLLLLLPCAPAFAQPTFEREVLYTRAAGTGTLRKVTVTYTASPVPTLTLSTPATIASPTGADGLCISPAGDVLVAGGATAPNTVHRVLLANNALSTVSPGAGSPIATQLALDPAGDKVWAVCTVSGTGRIARVPLSPFVQGIAQTITGPDTLLSHIGFGHNRAYYVAAGTAPGTGTLGTIDLTTFATTRLLNGLDTPRGVTLDPFTGHLIVFGAASITQIDARPGMMPTIVSTVSLAALLPGVDVRSGTVDGAGRALALSSTGHMVLVDYAATRTVGDAASPRVLAALETPGTLGSIVPLVGTGALRDSGCLWDNGEFDRRDGLPSHNSWMNGDTRTADDFYLCPGVHRIDAIEATMFAGTQFLTALIEVYDDCNGVPGALLQSFPATVTDTGELFMNLRVLALHAPTPGLWLRGGRSYWVSAVGIGSLDGSDSWYWGTSGAPDANDPPGTRPTIRGKPAYFRAPAQGLPDWTPSEEGGCGCTDFAFRIRGESCRILHDNGPPQAFDDPQIVGAPSIISSTSSDSRSADNFRVPPCTELGGRQICFIQATIYTNCSPVRGTVEIFINDCTLPSGPALYSGPFSKVIDLGYNVTIAGASLRAYTVEVHDPGWFLADGANYWLSVAVQGSGGFSQRAYMAANSDRCDAPGCGIAISQAAVRGPGIPSTGWVPIENFLQVPRDLSFVIAIADPRAQGGGAGIGDPEPVCIADADQDGDVDVADIFSFLSGWFQGCP